MNLNTIFERVFFTLLLTIILTIGSIPLAPSQPTRQRGPAIDKLRLKVIKSPDPQLIAMRTGNADVWASLSGSTAADGGLMRPGDVETLYTDGFTVTAAPGFHMGHIGINIRPDQSYRGRPEIGPILSDVNFRHALFHAFNQLTDIASIFKYVVTPIGSLVPPAQGCWMYPNAPEHRYNLGDPEVPPDSGGIEYRAAIIGVSEYDDPDLDDLHPCDDNAIKLREALLKWPNWNEANIDILVSREQGDNPPGNIPPTKANIIGALMWIGLLADENDVTLICLQGHGGYVSDGNEDEPEIYAPKVDEIFFPSDAGYDPETKAYSNYISDDDLAVELEWISGNIIVIMDCCYAGGFAGKSPPNRGKGFAYEWPQDIGNTPGLKDRVIALQRVHATCKALNSPIGNSYYDSFAMKIIEQIRSEKYSTARQIYQAWEENGDQYIRKITAKVGKKKFIQRFVTIWDGSGDDPQEFLPDHSASSIMWESGYVYDPKEQNWLTPYDLDGNGTFDDYLPIMKLYTPTYEVAPTSAEIGARLCADCQAIGIPIIHEPREFSPYLAKVFGEADFDLYMMFWNLDRFPDHLYDMCHSSQDCLYYPWRYNAPGIHDPELDALVETLKFSLDHDEQMLAAWEAQGLLSNSFAYVPIYSQVYFNAHQPGLKGIINSPGYGSDNPWTQTNMRWESGHPNERIEAGKTVVVWCLQDEPERLNPTYAGSTYAWTIMNPIFDSLIAVNPYTHEDLPWMATSWESEGPISETVTLDSENRYLGVPAGGTVDIVDGMKITFNLNSGVEWHDGNPYTPSDAEFSLEFLRNNEIPRYASMWMPIVDVQVISSTAFVVYLDVTSQLLFYDIAHTAALLPPPVWIPLDGKPLPEILAYDPANNLTKPTGAGDLFGTDDCPTQLYGTGPFVFVHYDPVAMYTDMPANRYYFKTTQEIQDQIVEMFYYCGDANRDGQIWGEDKVRYSFAYGCVIGDECYDADADLNGDGIVDALDGILINLYWGNQREYP